MDVASFPEVVFANDLSYQVIPCVARKYGKKVAVVTSSVMGARRKARAILTLPAVPCMSPGGMHVELWGTSSFTLQWGKNSVSTTTCHFHFPTFQTGSSSIKSVRGNTFRNWVSRQVPLQGTYRGVSSTWAKAYTFLSRVFIFSL